MSSHIGKRAIVVGAGMGGLAAAGALADYFEQVLLLERDRLPEGADPRAGTPQSKHLHALLGGGAKALEELFPGLERGLTQAGAVVLDFPLDARIERFGYYPFPQRKLDVYVHAASRPLIEFTVRQLLQQRANVTIRTTHRVEEILRASTTSAVTGVRYRNHGNNSEQLSADLVIDASGRGALTLDLLKCSGLTLPPETSIGMDIGYATARFATPENETRDWKGVSTGPNAPQSSRGGVLYPCENNQWIVTLYGMHGDKPPGGWTEFLSYAQSLRTRTIYEAISRAEPIGDIHRFAVPASVLRHFEQVGAFPRGLLPIGDAICRFNPVFAQGMSVAAIEAVTLKRLLSLGSGTGDPLADLAIPYFAQVQEMIKTPWSAAILDLVFPETSGSRGADFERTLKFLAGIYRLASQDAAAHKLMTEVQHLLKPNSEYRSPEFVRRVEAVMAEV